MAYKFSVHAVEDCLPLLSRRQLLSDVLNKQLYGSIQNVWHYPGHIFITSDNGRKLFTFDCEPSQSHQGFSSSSLDVQNSPFSIVDVIFVSSSLYIVVEGNGYTQWWRYSKGFDWYYIGCMELCSLVDSTVSCITYLPSSKTLVWCERSEKAGDTEKNESSMLSESSSLAFCIKTKTISTEVTDLTAQSLREQEVNPNKTLISNCPECDLFALASDRLFIRTKVQQDQVTVSLVCDVQSGEMVMFLGKDKYDIPPSTLLPTGLDFGSFLLNYLSTIIKMETNQGDLGIKTNHHQLVSLSSTGLMEIFNFADNGKSKIDYCTVQAGFDNLAIPPGHWFLYKDFVGIFHNQTLRLFSTRDGSSICEWIYNDIPDVVSVMQTSSPAFLTWVLTSQGLLALQATDSKVETAYSSPEHLPENDLLQTTALQLVNTHQLKNQAYDKSVLDKLENLRNAWTEGKGAHQSQIFEILAPLLDKYWKLDNTSKVLLDEKKVENEQERSYDRFAEELTQLTSLSKRAQDSRLLLLSQKFPQELLTSLCDGITLDSEDVIESELCKWQSLLGIGGLDLSKFEIVCRLLFKLCPEKLYHFVECAESASEKSVGVSAFVRKRHSLLFYKRASNCLPLAETSHNPSVAAAAQGRLIFASGGVHCVQEALKHLLRHELWKEALVLLKTQTTDKEHFSTYLYITMAALSQNHCLSEHIKDLFELMPTWRSFLSFAQLASSQPEIRQQQLSTSPADLFCQENSHVNLGTVQQSLLKLIENMEENKMFIS